MARILFRHTFCDVVTRYASDDKFLVTLLGWTDGLFLPSRERPARDRRPVHQERAEYFKTGIPLRGTGSAADRQSLSRMLARLRNASLITTAGTTRLRVRLTADGFARASGLVATYLPSSSYWLLAAADAIAATKCTAEQDFIPECFLIGRGYDEATPSDLVALELRALPLLTRGLLGSNADGNGYVGYCVTDAGRDFLRSDPEPVQSVATFNQMLADVYDAAVRETVQKRTTWSLLDSHELYIPLSAGLWPRITQEVRDIASCYMETANIPESVC